VVNASRSTRRHLTFSDLEALHRPVRWLTLQDPAAGRPRGGEATDPQPRSGVAGNLYRGGVGPEPGPAPRLGPIPTRTQGRSAGPWADTDPNWGPARRTLGRDRHLAGSETWAGSGSRPGPTPGLGPRPSPVAEPGAQNSDPATARSSVNGPSTPAAKRSDAEHTSGHTTRRRAHQRPYDPTPSTPAAIRPDAEHALSHTVRRRAQ
jgi:hypothetical protein